jgi:hypothetical protein
MTLKHLLKLAVGTLLLAATGANAQSTDGYHSYQVIPLVADTGSFTSSFNFTTPNTFPVTVTPRFYPGKNGTTGNGTTIGTPLTCPNFVIPAQGLYASASLRTLCPGITAPNTYGFVTLEAAPSSDGMYSDIPVFAAFTRMQDPQGKGTTVEGFPASTFTSAETIVNGLRRVASTATTPQFQTNCFIGNMSQLDPDPILTPPSATVTYSMRIGGTNYGGSVTVAPGELVRFLDIFGAAGVPVGNQDNIAIVFTNGNTVANDNRAGLLTYCTVQDNTSYGSDFRIGKQAYGTLGIASIDGLAARESVVKVDVKGRVFEIGPGDSANTHVVYFKHPDRVQCELLNPVTYARLTPAAGLEMRASDSDMLDAVGGNNATGTGMVFTGDKSNHDGYNNRYVIEVESNEQNTGVSRPYALYCASGSGNTFGYDIIKYQEAVDRF